MRELIIKPTESGGRADKFIFRFLPLAGKSFVYKMLRKKNITLNGAKMTGGEILNPGDVIRLFLSEETIKKFIKADKPQPAAGKLDIVYEDDDLLIINKPAGLLTQPAKKNEDSLTRRAAAYLNQDFTPACANRLDRNTAGLVMFGKNLKAVRDLNEAIAQGRVRKLYLAVVIGAIDKHGVLRNGYIKDAKTNTAYITDLGKEIETRYKPIKTANGYSLLEIELITGKSHQIRLHLKSAGYPVLGDKKYGDRDNNIKAERLLGMAITRQCLFAHKYSLDGRVFEASLPREFLVIARKLSIMP